MAGAKKIKLPKRKVTPERFREMAREATEAVQQRRAAAQIAADSIRAGRSAFAAEDGTREERLARTMNSALEFGRTYLPHYFVNEGAPFHEALDKLLTGNYTQADLERWEEEFGIEAHEGDPLLRLMSIEIFRGGGKSVIANLCDSLRRICHGLDPYLIIAGDTFAQAGAQLEDIKDELGSNEKIIQDFGRLKPAKGGQWQEVALIQDAEGRVTWREGQVITTNGVRVDAIGRGGKMRGRRHGAQRPTCAKLDDLDNDENVQTKAQRDKVWNWIMSAVIPALDPERGQVQLIGTTIHFDCAVARASRKKDAEGRRLFTTIKFTAMRRDKDGNLVSNWPARFTTAKLLRVRDLLGPSKFGAEYMNDPRDPDQQLFDVDKFVTYIPAELQGKDLKMILYIDPSMGKKSSERRKKSDFIGFAKTKADRKAKISYLVEADRKRLKPASLKAYAVDWYRRALAEDPDAELWIEENSFGALMGENFQDELRAQEVNKRVHTKLHSLPKPSRIERLSDRVDTGGVRFPARMIEGEQPEWMSEFVDYPGAFDDTIDAIETADDIGCSGVEAAGGGSDPEGETSRDRMQADKENRWMARLRGFGSWRRAA